MFKNSTLFLRPESWTEMYKCYTDSDIAVLFGTVNHPIRHGECLG